MSKENIEEYRIISEAEREKILHKHIMYLHNLVVNANKNTDSIKQQKNKALVRGDESSYISIIAVLEEHRAAIINFENLIVYLEYLKENGRQENPEDHLDHIEFLKNEDEKLLEAMNQIGDSKLKLEIAENIKEVNSIIESIHLFKY